MHPFPAEHDQQQAEALETLRNAPSFILITFSMSEGGHCSNPECVIEHEPHSTTSVLASCSSDDLHRAAIALEDEIMLTQSVQRLMRLSAPQRDQIAGMLRREDGYFLKLSDDEG
jgi:hypothetical protein